MLNDIEIKELFEVPGKSYIDRAILGQKETRFCKSFLRNKLMLRYSFEIAMQLVRDEVYHKIMNEKPNLIKDSLNELLFLRENIQKLNFHFFNGKGIAELLPNYVTLLNYLGIHTKYSKLCNRIRNFSIICKRYVEQKLTYEIFFNEVQDQLASLERKLCIYLRSDLPDILVYILRYDLKICL